MIHPERDNSRRREHYEPTAFLLVNVCAADFWLTEVPGSGVGRLQPWSKLSSFRSTRIHPPVGAGVLRFPRSGSRWCWQYREVRYYVPAHLCECHCRSTNMVWDPTFFFFFFACLWRSISSPYPSARRPVQFANLLCHCIFRSTTTTTSDTSPTVHTDSGCVVSWYLVLQPFPLTKHRLTLLGGLG